VYTIIECSADTRLEEHREAMAVINCTGHVLWIPQSIFFSSCPIDITHFPFDAQTCTLEFGSWTFDAFQLNLVFFEELEQVCAGLSPRHHGHCAYGLRNNIVVSHSAVDCSISVKSDTGFDYVTTQCTTNVQGQGSKVKVAA